MYDGRKYNDKSTHFIYGYMVKDHSDSKSGNLLPLHGLLFFLKQQAIFYMHRSRQDSTYHNLCCTSCGTLAGMKNSSMGIHKSHNYILFSVHRKEGNILFNNALNTFYLRLYGVRHIVKDHSDSERGNPLPPHRLLFSISSKGSFICIIPQTG